MGAQVGTQYSRSELGIKPTDVFLVYVLTAKGWGYQQLVDDMRAELEKRVSSSAARSLHAQIMARIRAKTKLSKVVDALKSARDTAKSAKKFDLSPKVIADAASSVLSGLWTMATVENELGNDWNSSEPQSDAYYDRMMYSYCTRGRFQPRYNPPPKTF